MDEKSGHDRVVILVKALPEVSDRYGETVCCAGLTPSGEWRRLFPIRFRQLRDSKFSRWQSIEYDWRSPKDDPRRESQRVVDGSIEPLGSLRQSEREKFLGPHILASVAEAQERGQTLALVRPLKSNFFWTKKKDVKIEKERAAYKRAAAQLSFLDKELVDFNPCPYEFRMKYETADGRAHVSTCLDWETTATFYKQSKKYGDAGALEHLDKMYNARYPEKGMAFAMGTHSRYKNTWLLVGIIRVDQDQMSMPV